MAYRQVGHSIPIAYLEFEVCPLGERRCPVQVSGLKVSGCPGKGLKITLESGNLQPMKTLTVDDHKRIRIPDAKPRQVFAYENHGDGTITLTEVKAERKERFPRGSLVKYLTPERDREQLEIL